LSPASRWLDRHAALRLAKTTLWGLICHAELAEAGKSNPLSPPYQGDDQFPPDKGG